MSSRPGALRRRRKRSLATRLRILWVFVVTIVGAAAYGAYVLVTLPALRVQTIAVRIDGLAVSEREVLRAASVDRTRNIWLLNTAQIARRIEAIPYVDTAIVRRAPPAHLTIAVTERVPAACLRSGARLITIDGARRILQDGCVRPSVLQIALPSASLGGAGSAADLPALADLLEDSRALRAAGVDVRSMRMDPYGELIAVDRGGIEMLFGSAADVADNAKLVAPVLAAARPGRSIRAIDLRAPATPTVEFR